MSQGEPQPAQPAQQSEIITMVPASPVPAIGGDQWNKDITGILTSNANNAIAEFGFNPNVLRTLKAADNDIARLKEEKRTLENKCRDLSAHLALANNRIDFAKFDTHTQWKEVIYYREKYHVLQRQYQEVLRTHSACATGPPEQPYNHLLQELEKLQDMYRHILGQNATLKFEVQRLMQQCVNSGLIPPPQNYSVTPVPALQPPAHQPATARRVSEPAIASHSQQTQGVQQQGTAVRQFASPPLNSHVPNRSTVSNQMIVAGPAQAYNYHRVQFPPPQQAPVQLMPPPQQLQRTPPQQLPSIRPRPSVDLSNSDDERVSKRPRVASDPDVSTQYPAGPSNYPQHPGYAQVPSQAPYQALQQRRPQVALMDHMQRLPMQPNYQQRPAAEPTDLYRHGPPPTSPSFRSLKNALAHPTSAPPIMDAYRTAASDRGAIQTQGEPPNAHNQTQEIGRPQQVHTGPAHPANVASRIPPAADARTSVATIASPAETPAEGSTGTPLASTPAAPPPDSASVSPQTMNGQVQSGGASLPPLTEEQTKQMRSELADSMFTEPEDEETQARVCMFCDRRRELGILTVPFRPFFKPTTEEMYLHLQAEHSESLAIEERDWKMELFGIDLNKNQQQ